ncbi:MAG: site-specific DNA-methyltransferase [Aquisalinus sp.]|nr:site-specific DNA-methyltransferase [Aquisalinus sp.]
MPTLNWLTREEDIRAAARVPYRLLEEVPDLSYGAADTGNMLIQGDNLDALKALLPYYAGKVKCIYIDPPYNTGSAFEHYDDALEHSKWLAMMWPRLELLRELLSEDGSIWVSIDDREAHYLKVIMDEVFGRKNFIDTIVWRKNYSPKSSARHFSSDHDYIVVYARNEVAFKPNLMPRTAKQDKAYKNPDNDPRGPWKTSDLSARNFYSLGTYSVTSPAGRIIKGPPKGRFWTISEENFRKLDQDNQIWWGQKGDAIPQKKRFLIDVKQGVVPQTVWHYDEAGHTQAAKKEIVALFGLEVFGTPKPEKLIERVLQVGSNPGDLVLDSFLGSGTTAAVAQKMGRRYIGIELGDHAVTHCQPRLKKVIDGEQGGISKAVNWQGGGGFHFYKLGEPVFTEDGQIRQDIKFPLLAAHIWFAETKSPWTAPKKPKAFLGVSDGRGVALLYNGILADKSIGGGNVLTRITLKEILKGAPKDFAGPLTVYAARSALSPATLKKLNITFRQTPYDVKGR